MKFQVVISGVGGQGVLFVTQLLAEAAIARGLPVLTSETHGMAQRGGTVVSHLKAGDFSSPLIRSGRADALLLLKSENRDAHGHFLKPGGWRVVNAPNPLEGAHEMAVDADRLAMDLHMPKSLNLILLGFALSCGPEFFCSVSDIKEIVKRRPGGREEMRAASLRAIETGERQAAAVCQIQKEEI